MYESHVVVQLNLTPLVVAFVGSLSLNVGFVQSVLPAVREALEPLRRAVHAAQVD